MSTGDRDDVFLQKLQEFDSLIRYASRRYHIPGVLDPDDLYQEGLLILDRMLRDDYEYAFDPDSLDFRKMFKTELWHGLWKVLQQYRTQKRDWKKLAGKDYSQIEWAAARSGRILAEDGCSLNLSSSDGHHIGGVTGPQLANKFDAEVLSSGLNPEQIAEFRENVDEVDDFLDILIERLDDKARIVLHELLCPRSWDEIPREYKTNGSEDEYWRVPKKIPQHVLARMLDWPLIRVRRAMSRIREQAGGLGDELGFDLLATAGLKQKQRRRKNVT